MDGRSKRKKDIPTRYCEVCNKEIPRNTKQGENRTSPSIYVTRRFCSLSCKAIKLATELLGSNNPNWRGGNSHCGICGNELTTRYSRRNSANDNFCADCSHKYFSNTRHPNWRGRISGRPGQVLLWRKGVYIKDDFTCQKCGDNTGGNLNAHHIFNWADNKNLRYLISNGVTFCEKCHIDFHKKYGYRNNTEEQLLDFIK